MLVNKNIRLKKDGYLVISYKFAAPNVNAAVLEDVAQSAPQLIGSSALFQNSLQKASAACAAYHFAFKHIVNGHEDLVNAGVRAADVKLFGKLPVLVHKLCESVDVFAFKLVRHKHS